MDRGFDNRRMFKGMTAIGVRWICRLKVNAGARHFVDSTGRDETVMDIVCRVVDRWNIKLRTGRRGRVLNLKFGSRKVWMRNEYGKRIGAAMTLVVVWGFGKDPLALLVSEPSASRGFASEVVHAYLRRWRCEEASRAMKDSHGWGVRVEDIRALTIRGVQRLATLAIAICLMMTEMLLADAPELTVLLVAVRLFSGRPPDATYRLLRGMGVTFAKIPRWLSRGWRRA